MVEMMRPGRISAERLRMALASQAASWRCALRSQRIHILRLERGKLVEAKRPFDVAEKDAVETKRARTSKPPLARRRSPRTRGRTTTSGPCSQTMSLMSI